jgi:hypothetical protein
MIKVYWRNGQLPEVKNCIKASKSQPLTIDTKKDKPQYKMAQRYRLTFIVTFGCWLGSSNNRKSKHPRHEMTALTLNLQDSGLQSLNF